MGKGKRSRAETQAHHVSISPQEDRGGTKSEMGEGESAAEVGCSEPDRRHIVNLLFSVYGTHYQSFA
ncbi:MAG: hypothetical protein ABSG40_08765 [Terriglobales bacterium]|jgi:hypothetical protein